MIKKFAKLIVSDDGVIRCSKCDKVLADSTPSYFYQHQDASDVWLSQLADQHFHDDVCSAIMADAKKKITYSKTIFFCYFI
mgnify:FL=1